MNPFLLVSASAHQVLLFLRHCPSLPGPQEFCRVADYQTCFAGHIETGDRAEEKESRRDDATNHLLFQLLYTGTHQARTEDCKETAIGIESQIKLLCRSND